jgi:hypothetical protein
VRRPNEDEQTMRGRSGAELMLNQPGVDSSTQRRNLAGASLAHMLHDGYVRRDSLNVGYSAVKQKPPTLHRMDINLASRKISDVQLADMVVEFPWINDALDALPTRFP